MHTTWSLCSNYLASIAVLAVGSLYDEDTKQSSLLEVASLGAATGSLYEMDGNSYVYPVCEDAQGAFSTGVDLNGDGDTSDDVLHLHDAVAGRTTNLGLALTSGFDRFTAEYGRVAFLVDEQDQGTTDLNGDGDPGDIVVHVVDNGEVENIGIAAFSSGGVFLGRHIVAFPATEQNGQGDLNGDGDKLDGVVHVHDFRSGTTTNLGLATFSRLILRDDLLAFPVDESSQAFTDLNGDGDVGDQVIHVFETGSGSVVNLGLAVFQPTLISDAIQTKGRFMGFVVREAWQGALDLNGDGDAFDSVLHLYDRVSRSTINLGLAIESGSAFSVGDRLVAAIVKEADQGQADLNLDGDKSDDVLFVYDLRSGATTNLGLAAWGSVEARKESVVFRVDENDQGQMDFNGDGDWFDTVFHVYRGALDQTSNLGLQSSADYAFNGKHLGFLVQEVFQGGTDLNGDGDGVDQVLHAHELETGLTTNFALATFEDIVFGALPRMGRTPLAIHVAEIHQGRGDLNGDGDLADSVLHVVDLRTGLTHNTGVATTSLPEAEGHRVLFLAGEFSQGEDLNSDGDTADVVLHSAVLTKEP